ncbi:MAG: TolC family protein [Geobacteraceae bacterium]|nr:TolC family protein [Geobacteraceae bacterium]
MSSYCFRLLFLVLPLVWFGVGLAGYAHAGEDVVSLTLKEAIRMALEKNLEVRAELYNPAMDEADIRKNRGIYDPFFSISTNYQQSTTQSASTLLSGASISRQKNFQADAGINQLVPIGGNLGLFFTNLWNRNNADSSRGFLDEYWQSQLTLSYSQPLLKNFGREATELGIAVAVNNKAASLDQFKSKLIDVVTRVRTAYFTLYSLKENLAAKKTALTLAQKILEDTKGRVRAGVLPAMEVLNAEFGVATREKELIDAEKLLLDQKDVVRILLQTEGNQNLDPVDPPTREKYPVEENEAISLALSQRPDLLAQRVALQTLDLQSRVAHNRIMPDLTFIANTAVTGLERDFGRDMKKVGSADYPVWEVGLQFSYPLGNREAKNDFIKSRLLSEQAQVQLKSLEDTIRNDVRIAIRGITANFLQLDVADRGLAYAEERLRAYIKKNEVGLATTKELVDVQNDLVAAQTNQIRARAEYTIAIGQLWKATGELLEREGIILNEKEADQLYTDYTR